MRLLEQRAQAHIRLQRQLRAVHEVSARLASSGRALITIKGFSTYALTGDERHIRYSGDLDILFSDPDDLGETLKRLGYHQAPPEEEYLGEHESAKAYRDDIQLELHRYFPVWSYPPGVATADLTPARHPGRWVQRFAGHSHKEISYQDLVENSSRGLTPETCDLLVADATMCVLIYCAHELRNFMHSPIYTPDPIRLAELADIHDLVQHPRFDQERFVDLVERFEGHDSVEFVGHLLEAYLGSNSLAFSSLRSCEQRVRTGSFTRLVTVGCWVSLYHCADEVLLPLSLNALVSRLGANKVVATTSGDQRPLSVLARPGEDGAQAKAGRAIVQTTQCQWPSIRLSVAWQKEGLDFEIFIGESAEDDDYHYSAALFCGSPRRHDGYHSVDVCQQRTVLNQNGQGEASMSVRENRCELHLRLLLPWETLPGAFGKSAVNPVVLQLQKLRRIKGDETSFAEPDVVIVVPLHLVLP